MKFRYDINALRALAVISVFLFHLKIPLFSGGFIGVDVFYTISGFLMSKIVIDGLQKNTFSIWDFYSKRIKRIVPALLFLIFMITSVGYFIFLPNDYKTNDVNAFSSLLFYSNFHYWKDSLNYFRQQADSNIFLHTWSLSVEWQFYMIYPLFLLVLKKLGYTKFRVKN